METTQLDRNVVKQHNDIIGGKYNLNPNEIKFILTIVAQIKMEDEDFKPYTITKKELEERWGVELNEARLKEFADGILSKPFSIKRPPPDGSKKKSGGFIAMNWFSSIEYKEHQAIIEASFDPKLKPYLLDLKGTFTTFNLGYALKFKSAYAIRIYQLIKQFEPKGYYRTKVADLQEILKVPDSLKVYADFKRYVLNIALKEINQHSDLQVALIEQNQKGTS
jgi:plasmid replication initiation protein